MACQACSIIAVILVFVQYSLATSSSFPVLTWSAAYDVTKDHGDSVLIAGKTIELSDAYEKYIEPLINNKPLVIIFLQDELSVDDFSKYSSSFTNLQKILEVKNYTLLPSVSCENRDANDLFGRSTNEIEYVDSSNLHDWKYKDPKGVESGKKMIIFNLEPVQGSDSEGKGEILKRNDLAIGKIIESIEGIVDDFGAVLMAEAPSEQIANVLLGENIDMPYTSRHLLSTSNNTETFFNNTCAIMYMESLKHTSNNYNGSTLTTEFVTSGGKWKVGGDRVQGCSITLEREGNVGPYEDATLEILFENATETGQWNCHKIIFSYNLKSHSNTTAPTTAPTTAAPTTSAPATTKAPPTTSAPATTGAPATTSAPATTGAPATTSAPATTGAPAATSAPATTKALATTSAPATTGAPATTPATTSASTSSKKAYYNDYADGATYITKNFDYVEEYSCGANMSQFQSSVYNEIVAPLGMSFACYKLTFTSKGKTNGSVSTLTIGGFQTQPSFVEGTLQRFSGAYNCVGFFSLEILTVIFVTAILMIGLWVGIMMMMAIQVQERTDDPKGKPLTIATTID